VTSSKQITQVTNSTFVSTFSSSESEESNITTGARLRLTPMTSSDFSRVLFNFKFAFTSSFLDTTFLYLLGGILA
jgi:hypothetical protein